MVDKDEWLKIRVTSKEKKQLQRQAKYEGLSLSAWLRTVFKAALRKAAALKRSEQSRPKGES